MLNAITNNRDPSWGRVTIPAPRSGTVRPTALRFKITNLQGPNSVIGPVIKLLLAIEALYQRLPADSNIWHIAVMDHAGLIDYRHRINEGDPQVIRAIRAGLSEDLVRDAVAFAEASLLLEHCLQT